MFFIYILLSRGVSDSPPWVILVMTPSLGEWVKIAEGETVVALRQHSRGRNGCCPSEQSHINIPPQAPRNITNVKSLRPQPPTSVRV